MFYFLRKIIDFLTFPGVIMHEIAHKEFCAVTGVRVIKVKYLQFRGREAGYVIHEPAKNFLSTFLISTGPILINSFFCLIIAGIAFNMDGGILDVKKFLLFWLAFSIGAHSFPSDADAGVVLDYSKRQMIERMAIFHVLSFPFYFAIKFMNFLRRFGFDYIYAFFVIYLAFKLVS